MLLRRYKTMSVELGEINNQQPSEEDTTTSTQLKSHDFDSLFAHTVCATAYNENSCNILIEENGFATLTSLLRRPSEEQLAIEKKCANAVLKLAQDEETRRKHYLVPNRLLVHQYVRHMYVLIQS